MSLTPCCAVGVSPFEVLESLESIGGDRFVGANESLVDFDGFESLVTVDGVAFIGLSSMLCEDLVDLLVVRLGKLPDEIFRVENNGVCP